MWLDTQSETSKSFDGESLGERERERERERRKKEEKKIYIMGV